MHICIYGTKADKEMFLSTLGQVEALSFRQYEADWFSDYDVLIKAIKQSNYDLSIILKDNACGMEGVIAVKSLCPEMPVIWFSNDPDFGAQSYRLNASYFHKKPVTVQLLNNALTSSKLI